LLEELGLLEKEEPYENNVGFSERANVPIEPRLSEQWFLKYPSVPASTDCVKNGDMKFFPDRWAKTYDHWLSNIQDWCISRQLWWGHQIPVWNHKETGEIHCDLEPPADEENWTRDPDVLDTWFSSWLWPFATMGWPDKTADLKAFYPTSDLVTGPDIIFFWVARMIMAGYEYMGEMPFRHVYYTGIIRDKKGRKMSKSLGNSPDPLDLIERFGADALRFGTMRSAPLGLDVLFDEKDVELGRNFCNKLWNSCRYRQMQGGTTEGEINKELLTSDDRWILMRLDEAIREVDEAFSTYRFNNVTRALYRFFKTEYCDWYLEASKAVMFGEDEAQKTSTLAVMDFIISNMLRLFHPFMPFITEDLWHGMGFNKDLPEEQGGKTLMTARWPKAFGEDMRAHYGLDETVDKLVGARNELVSAGRNLRAEFNIPPNKRIKFLFEPAGTADAHEIEVLRLLLTAESVEAIGVGEANKGTPSVTSLLGTIYLPLDGLVDVEAEKARLAKEAIKIDKEIEKVEKKLGNPSFAEKVPAEVLQEHRDRLVNWQTKKDSVLRNIEALG
ncbi:MAG: valyl-tRNA synthetase, partial [Limisphaerales bacterium]